MELERIIEKLVQNRTYTQCFMKGALVNLPEENFIEKVNELSIKCWEGCSDVLRSISAVIIKRKNELINLARNGIRQSDYEIEKDITFCAETFTYYSRLAHKVEPITQRMPRSTNYIGMILEDCPIFTTLSSLIAARISARDSITLFVNSKYSVISVYFAAILIEAGLPEGAVNVVPYFDKKSLPLIASQNLSIVGVIPELLEQLPEGNLHFSKALVKKNSLCPIIILKSADIDSAIDSIVTCTQSNDVFWFPNAIYVEEACYEKFLQCLKFVVKNRNTSYDWKENNSEVDQKLEKFIKGEKNNGFEVIELIHRFLKCVFLINNDTALNTAVISDDEKSTYHRAISVIPIRTTQEVLSFVNNSSGGAVASVWTNDAVEIMSLPFKLEYGTIWVNSVNNYSPAVPFSPWGSFGYGTFLGKRGFFENFVHTLYENLIFNPEYLYLKEKNAQFPKKDISSVTKQSLSTFGTWHKSGPSSRASFLETVSTQMRDTWNTHLKTILTVTNEDTWQKGASYMKFWASYIVDKVYQQSFDENNFQIISRNKPLGVIAILADQIPVDELVFVISAGLAFGNAIVVGISKNEKSSIPAAELENLFKSKPGLVNVVVDDDENLWSQFVSNGDISSIWISAKYSKFSSKKCIYRNIIEFGSPENMTLAAEMYEINATKQQSIWLPSLC